MEEYLKQIRSGKFSLSKIGSVQLQSKLNKAVSIATVEENVPISTIEEDKHPNFKKHDRDISNSVDSMGSYVIIDSKMLLEIIYEGYLEKPCNECGKYKIYLDSYSSSNGASTLKLSCHNKRCDWKKVIPCSFSAKEEGKRIPFQDLPARMIYSFMIAELTYQNYEEVLAIMDVEHLGKSGFSAYSDKLNEAVMKLLDPVLQENRKKLQLGNTSIVIMDGRWNSRGWNANECTVLVFNAVTKELLDIEHVLRKLNSADSYGSYYGASSAMEGVAVHAICKRWKKENIPLHIV
jgi:hypothetical protein